MMANQTVPAMHPDFPRWYREVSLDENRDRLQRRWAGVAALAKVETDKDIENALRIAFRAKQSPSQDGQTRIRQLFSKPHVNTTGKRCGRGA